MSRVALDPTSEAMQSARDIYAWRAAGEHANASRPLVPAIDETLEGMLSARSMYNAADKSGCESESDSDSDGSSISQRDSPMHDREMCLTDKLSSTEDETDEHAEDSNGDRLISADEKEKEEETCFDLDALFDSQRQIVGIEEVAAEQDPSESESESIASSIRDLPACEREMDAVSPRQSPCFELDCEDGSESASEIMEELERVFGDLGDGEAEIEMDFVREGLLDLDPATLQRIGEYAEGEDNDPSPSQQEMNGKEQKKRWLHLRKLWKSRASSNRQSNGGAKGGLKIARWCRKWAGKKTRKVFRFFMRTGTRRGEGQQ